MTDHIEPTVDGEPLIAFVRRYGMNIDMLTEARDQVHPLLQYEFDQDVLAALAMVVDTNTLADAIREALLSRQCRQILEACGDELRARLVEGGESE